MFTKFAALAAAATVIAAPSAAATFDFAATGRSSITNGGVTVWASAWSVADLNAATSPVGHSGGLGVWAEGLGVDNGTEQDGVNRRTHQHAIDNVDRYDFVALYFDQAVTLTGMKLNAFAQFNNQAADKDAWISYVTLPGDGTSMSTIWSKALSNGFNAADGVLPSTAGKVGNVWIIGAARSATERNDGFKLGSVSANIVTPPDNVTAVPEPATWATMMLGFGFAGAAMRRRRTRVAFAA